MKYKQMCYGITEAVNNSILTLCLKFPSCLHVQVMGRTVKLLILVSECLFSYGTLDSEYLLRLQALGSLLNPSQRHWFIYPSMHHRLIHSSNIYQCIHSPINNPFFHPSTIHLSNIYLSIRSFTVNYYIQNPPQSNFISIHLQLNH